MKQSIKNKLYEDIERVYEHFTMHVLQDFQDKYDFQDTTFFYIYNLL